MALPLSVVLHRFERDHQDLSKPRIFVRQYDEDGFTTGFTINTIYQKTLGGKIDSLMEAIQQIGIDEIIKALDWLKDDETFRKLEIMVAADISEDFLYQTLKKINLDNTQDIDTMSPLFERKYDERGIPVSYRFNPQITTVNQREGGRFSINIDGLPISDEAIKGANIDEVLSRLLSSIEIS